jgi:hypothetical protein
MEKDVNMKHYIWFIGGLIVGFSALSFSKAAVPTRTQITDDTALYQKLSEIKISKEMMNDYDSDITRLSKIEGRYRENLPLSQQERFKAPMIRILKKKYVPTMTR